MAHCAILTVGAVAVTGVPGPGFFETSNSEITMSDVSGQFIARTSNGRIVFSGSLSAGSESSFTTSNGPIDASLGGEPGVAVDARTSNGSVVSDRLVLATTTEKTRLVGTYGTGAAGLELMTSNGSINIR